MAQKPFSLFCHMINLDFPTYPILETERLILRQQTIEDKHDVFRIRSDEELNKYLDRPKAHTVEDAEKHIERLHGLLANKEWLGWGITLKDDPKIIGGIGLWQFSHEEESGDVGYELLPEYHRRGIIKEALQRVIKFATDEMHLKKMTAILVPDNTASVQLLKSFGFQLNPDFKAGNEREVQYLLHLTGN
jgi:ribosomal-protein-alanine N-acetyltransferase